MSTGAVDPAAPAAADKVAPAVRGSDRPPGKGDLAMALILSCRP